LKLNPQQVIEKEKQIIGKYPNTYTFTKSLAERALKKRHGHVKLAIIRPSVVIGSAEEPVLGWTETISAMGSMTFAAMLGLINYLHSGDKLIFDAIPVDYVSNLILASTAKTACAPPGTLNVIHSTSSKQNPATVKFIVDVIMEYTQRYPSMK
jgi:fatty acyl-CoA reductase